MRLMRAYMDALDVAFRVVEVADHAASHACFYRKTRAVVLDNLFGPVEDFEYARPTTPA